MRTLIKSLCLVAIVGMSTTVLAQGKIAVLDVQEAIMNTDAAKKSIEDWRNKPDVADNIKQLEALKKEFQDSVERLQKDAAVLSAEKKQEESKKIQNKRADIEHVARKLQAAEKDLVQTLIQAQGQRLQAVVNDMIQADGIGLLLDRKAVMHVDSSYSITAKVTDKLNQVK